MLSLNAYIQSVLYTLLPQRCRLCQQVIESPQSSSICQCCQQDIPQFNYQISNKSIENLLLQPNVKNGLKNIQFHRLYSYAPYAWPFDQWITQLKFNGRFQQAKTLGALLANKLAQQYHNHTLPQVILPMPIHRWRRFSRGYNQAELIANVVAKRLKISVDHNSLKRVKSTKAQSSLGQRDRKSNVKNAFEFSNNNYQHVALLDDVITTGSTVNEVCKVLKQQGVTQIDIWTICATPLT